MTSTLNERIGNLAKELSDFSPLKLICNLRGVKCAVRIELKNQHSGKCTIHFEICGNGQKGQINFDPVWEPETGGYNYHAWIGMIDAPDILKMLEEAKQYAGGIPKEEIRLINAIKTALNSGISAEKIIQILKKIAEHENCPRAK